jgi:hypothetical protein
LSSELCEQEFRVVVGYFYLGLGHFSTTMIEKYTWAEFTRFSWNGSLFDHAA